jgi:hypothetical protein
VHGGADGGAHGEDGGAQPRKSSKEEENVCALSHGILQTLSGSD